MIEMTMCAYKRVELIVWSKDRAPQLRLLLESIGRYTPHMFNINVIYTYSNEEYKQGYEKVMAEFPANYILEKSLAQDTCDLIVNNLDGLIAFSTDDTVIFRAPPTIDLSELIPPGCCSFSLRYGLNTTLQDYYSNLYQTPLTAYKDEGDTIQWNWSNYNGLHNYGYPFGLDMHIYKASLINDLIKYETFKSTNQLESLLFKKKRLAPQMIRSFKYSIAINIPDNCMSGITRSSGNNIADMNSRFLSDEVISLDDIPTDFNACHYPVEYKWIKR